MSESSFPFEGQTLTEAPAAEQPESGRGSRATLFVLGGIVAALILAAAAYFLLFSGGDAEEAVQPTATPVAVVPTPVPSPADKAVKKQRLSAKSFGNDPFKPLIVEATDAGGSGAVVTDIAGGMPLTPAPAVAPAAAPAAPPDTSAPVSSPSHSFRVVKVAADNSSIDVKVDGELYADLKAGEVFATYFKVVLVSGNVNSFQFGEEKFNVIGTKRLTIA